MALLQIAEPGQSAAPHQHKLAAGIDLGTTNSLVATVRSGEAKTLSNTKGEDMVPSVVRYTENAVVVGRSWSLRPRGGGACGGRPALRERRPTHEVANEIARARIAGAAEKRAAA